MGSNYLIKKIITLQKCHNRFLICLNGKILLKILILNQKKLRYSPVLCYSTKMIIFLFRALDPTSRELDPTPTPQLILHVAYSIYFADCVYWLCLEQSS